LTGEFKNSKLEKTETVVNFVELKPNRKLQFFAKLNQSHFLPTEHPYLLDSCLRSNIVVV